MQDNELRYMYDQQTLDSWFAYYIEYNTNINTDDMMFLINNGANPNQYDNHPFVRLCTDNLAIYEYFINVVNVNINYDDSFILTNAIRSNDRGMKNIHIIKYLLDCNIIISNTAILFAVSNNMKDIIELFIEYGTSLDNIYKGAFDSIINTSDRSIIVFLIKNNTNLIDYL